ncbi:MAG: glycosyl hydrolase family 8 [Patescibacteria group bacterium]|nr:glycosyl hydrolase family 8 [Patescibacteria group bacterium]
MNKTIFKSLVIVVTLFVAAFTHSYNMFNYPYYENDEGTYMSQSWSLLNQGKLAPYTYWYDHAPAGWVLIAGWVKLTGGIFTFGHSINSGRTLMFIIHLATCLLLFYITQKLSGKLFPGVIAVLVFSLSPLAIYFQRRVLLDNIMVFWILLSLALLLQRALKLRYVLLSALTFSLAILTKENAIFFLPAFLYAIYAQSLKENRNFALGQWLAVSGLIVSTYFLFAFLQGELLPTGIFNNQPHVSLFSTLQFQFTRGSRLPFWNPQSDFYVNLQEWLRKDAFTIVAGAVSTIVSFLLSVKVRQLRIPLLLALLFWIFLLRGKVIIDFYVIPAIPLLSLNLGILLGYLSNHLSSKMRLYFQGFSFLVLLIGVYLANTTVSFNTYFSNETGIQIMAINWVKQNLSPESYLITDNYAYTELHDPGFINTKVFKNADWFWKLDYDPEIIEQKYQGEWQKINYLVMSHEMIKQISLGSQNSLKKAFDNATEIIFWKNKYGSLFDLRKLVSKNGDWAAIFKINTQEQIILHQSWVFFKKNFIKNYGQVIDPNNNDATTSEGQAYTMLRAVWEDDQATFDGVWQWTKDHLQYRLDDKLLSWLWVKGEKDYQLGDSASATDADEDIALALLIAYKKWGEEKYLSQAKEIINDIWKKEVVSINGHYLLVAGTDNKKRNGYLVNPSYFSPASYQIFARIDASHPWNQLADDSYWALNKITSQGNNKIFLPQNWVVINENWQISSASPYIEKNSDFYGFDSFRITWRLALDVVWFNNPKAKNYLKKVSPFFTNQWLNKGNFASLYDLSGQEQSDYQNLSTATGALATLSITNPEMAKDIFQKLYKETFDFNEGFWKDKNDYYDQSWGWFASAIYSHNLPNLWQ